MKKIKALAAVTAVIAMMFTTVAFAAPSPVAGIVTVTVPGKNAGAAQVRTPTAKEITALADAIMENAAAVGMVPNVKANLAVVAPADYKGGDIPTVFAVAGLVNGAKNVFAFILMPNGKTVIVPCTVRNGYVGFIAPAFGAVSIVELNPVASTAANAGNAAAAAVAVPSTLH